MILQDAKVRQAIEAESKDDNDSEDPPVTGGNSGTMIVDATCAPSNIRYPQDVSLLNEARENAEKLLDALHDPADGKKPRTYRKCARKDYLKYARSANTPQKPPAKQLENNWAISDVTSRPLTANYPLENHLRHGKMNGCLPSAPFTSSRSTCTITILTVFLTGLSV